MKHYLEDVFVTEGAPRVTFVRPPNYTTLLVDIRRAGKPVIVEGQSGTGKTTAVKKIVSEIYPENTPKLLTPRNPDDIEHIKNITEKSGPQVFIIDDFHRLSENEKDRLANLAKMIAEREDREHLPKLVIIGINSVGSDLIQMVPDIAKRIGIHRIHPGNNDAIKSLVINGCNALNIEISDIEEIVSLSRGDYWLTQNICKSICIYSDISETQPSKNKIEWDKQSINPIITAALHHNYDPAIREFCRGRRFRPTNDPYFKLLKAVSEQENSTVDLNELANTRQDIKGSINNVKDHRLKILLEQKESCSRLFYYDPSTKTFAIEDPALFYYIKNLDWSDLRQRCGFKHDEKDYEFDAAISFAGENREIAKFIVDQLHDLDISVFYDKNYEDNYLGEAWSKQFREIFVEKSRIVISLLDINHHDKVWPTFERD